MKKEIAIWGVGKTAIHFLYENRQKISVKYWIDSYWGERGEDINGKPILSFEETKKYLRTEKIIIAISQKGYQEVKAVLEQDGKEEYKDFIWYKDFNKKMCLVHGNCHTTVLKEYLQTCEKFINNYFIVDNPLIQDNIKGYIEPYYITNCDLFIHQDIREENGFGELLSDSYTVKKLKDTCINITIPNLFGFGKMFYPQFEWNDNNPPIFRFEKKDSNGMFPHKDIFIEKELAEGKSVEEIQNTLLNPEYLTREQVVENFNKYIEKMRIREENWDIKITN